MTAAREAPAQTVCPVAATATRHFPAQRPVLPEWTRYAWASMDERGWWDPYVRAASQAWPEIEKWAVADGVRDAAWVIVPPEGLPALTVWAEAHGLVVQPPRETVPRSSTYVSATARPDGGAWDYRVLLGRPAALASASQPLSDDALGRLLGYPDCCCRMFAETWGARQVDSTWDAFMGVPFEYGVKDGDATSAWAEYSPTADGPPEANLLWRWLGVRWVPHLPCSFTCERTVALGQQFREVALRHGYREQAMVIDEVLRWPVTWSAINGIAEIVGPCVKISTRTDWSPERRIFKRLGAYQRPAAWLWTDNGFTNPDGMFHSHQPILAALSTALRPNARIVDLGCGNGVLLKRLRLRRPDIRISGVDLKADAIAHARTNLIGSWQAQTIQDWAAQPSAVDAVLLSAVRVLELAPEDADRLRAALRRIPQVFVSAYSDNMAVESLTATCARAALPIPRAVQGTAYAQIGELDGTVAFS